MTIIDLKKIPQIHKEINKVGGTNATHAPRQVLNEKYSNRKITF